MSVRPGTELDGRYRLSDQLALGATGEVWRATDLVLRREVAVKVLRRELAEDDAFVRRFRIQARVTSGLPHGGIAATYDFGDGDGGQGYGPVVYLVMELVRGEPLSAVLARHGALGPERTVDLIAQGARALHAAHVRGVVHGDVRPANLMVTRGDRVKVIDFGSRRLPDHEPHYLAPELVQGRAAHPLGDVHALGVSAYRCLAGHLPLKADAHRPPLLTTLPARLRTAVASATERDPRRRTASAAAFADALDAARGSDPDG